MGFNLSEVVLLFINFGPRAKPVLSNEDEPSVSDDCIFYYMRWPKLRINFSSFFSKLIVFITVLMHAPFRSLLSSYHKVTF